VVVGRNRPTKIKKIKRDVLFGGGIISGGIV
jgi:hypothetical protein